MKFHRLLFVVLLVPVIGCAKAQLKPPTSLLEIKTYVPLQPIETNLATPKGAVLKFSMVVECDNPNAAEEVRRREFQIRDVLISIIEKKSIKEIQAFREALKGEIKNLLNTFLSSGKVTRIYFPDFLISF